MARRSRAEQVSLDVLLTDHEEGVDWVEPGRGRFRWLLKDLFIAAAGAGGAYAVILVVGLSCPFPVLFGIGLAGRFVRRALAAVPVPPVPPAFRSAAWGVSDPDEGRLAPLDGVVRSVERWEARFGWTERDAARFKSAVHPRLYELVDERLRQRHGITLRTHPARARELIGEDLWTFLHTRVARTPSVAEMAAVVAAMEKV